MIGLFEDAVASALRPLPFTDDLCNGIISNLSPPRRQPKVRTAAPLLVADSLDDQGVADRWLQDEAASSSPSSTCSIAYSPSGDLLAAGLYDGTVHIWDTRTGEEVISPMRSSDGAITSVVFAPDGQLLASGAENGAVSVWNVATGRLHSQRPQDHSKPVDLLTCSPDGKLVASVSWKDD